MSYYRYQGLTVSYGKQEGQTPLHTHSSLQHNSKLLVDVNSLIIIQPVQNVPAAGDFAAYNEISAAYFTLKSGM